jgi:hypothetical protein
VIRFIHNAIPLILAALMALGNYDLRMPLHNVSAISNAENLKGGDDDDKTKS